MPKQEHNILTFHKGTNDKFDPRDIEDGQNQMSGFAVNSPGRLTLEGSAKTLYSATGINGHTITTGIASGVGGFDKGRGLFGFSHDYDMDATPDEIDSDFFVINDANQIEIYDPNKSGGAGWANKFTLGSRISNVKPNFYNVDGALRACDSDFGYSDSGADTSAAYTKNDVTLSVDNGGGGNVTIATGSIIQIDHEIMYVANGVTGGTSIKVIRGFANTNIATHSNNTEIKYINIPKYFGHIKQTRLFECDTTYPVNAWVEDVQTPQPPNNTRKADTTAGTLDVSAGIQSLRVYDSLSGSTSNIPAEAEKVVLELGEDTPNYGITKVTSDGDEVTVTTSGFGDNASGNHGLANGDEIVISTLFTDLSKLGGTHSVKTVLTSTSFTLDIEGYDEADADYTDTEFSGITSWADNTGVSPGTVEVDVDNTALPSSGQFWIHVTGQTGVPAFNGVYHATAVSTDHCYFTNTSHGAASSGDTTGKVQRLLAVITRDGEDSISEDLKRKWNFAMSFTYDGPGQEVQESLLTQGYKITPALQASGASNLHALGSTVALDATTIVVDDGTQFSAGDIIMIESEQMRVNSVSSNNLLIGVGGTNVAGRGFNNTTAATHADNLQVYKVEELSTSATVDWRSATVAKKAIIKAAYGPGNDEKTWNQRINGFKIYMKDVTDFDDATEWRLFSKVNFNKGTYQIFAADDSELILEQPESHAISTASEGISMNIKPIDTYLSENSFTEETLLEAQYKTSAVVGRRVYIGNIRQGGRTYPDRMIKSPVNKFDTFPETNFIDVAVGDGDVITELMSFGDRLLQFKKNKVYVINVGGDSDMLEAEYVNAGVEYPSQVCRTNTGIMWINDSGLWSFDGKEVENLTRHVKDGGFPRILTGIPLIIFDKISNRVIFTDKIDGGLLTLWYIWDIELSAFQSLYPGHLFPTANGGNYYTNAITDSEGKIVLGFVDAGVDTEMNFYTWDNSNKGHQAAGTAFNSFWISKDIDFGSPSLRKKIYKIYVTYKSTGHSGISLRYETNGNKPSLIPASTEFSGTFANSTNYSTTQGIGFKDTAGGDGAEPQWTVAELIPSSSLNNIKSIQLQFRANYSDDSGHAYGTAQSGSANVIRLAASGPSDVDDAYNNYNILIYDGVGRYNSRRIIDYDGDGSGTEHTVTVYDSGASPTGTAFIDNGYNAATAVGSKYLIGSVSPDFEINDITIIYRIKPIK